MKLKNNFIIFLISIITVLGFRIYEIIKMSNSLSYKVQPTETICLICMLVFTVLIIFMSYLSKNIPQKLKLRKNTFLCTLTFIVSGLLMINGVSNVITLFTARTVEIILLFTGVLSVLSGIIFFVLGKDFSGEKNTFLEHQLIILVPVIWLIVRLYQVFRHYQGIAMQVQDMSSEIAIIFLLLYFTNFSRLLSGMYSQKVYKKLYMYSVLGAIFVFMSATYQALDMNFNSTASLGLAISLITDLCLALFTVSFVYFLSKNSEFVTNEKTENKIKNEESISEEKPSEIAPDGNEELKNEKQTQQEKAELSKNERLEESSSNEFDMNAIDKLIDEISN